MTANRIREFREAAGLTQEALGERLSMTKYKLSRLENEETKLDLDTAVKIANALGVKLPELIGIGAAAGFQEDAVAYDPGGSDPLARLADVSRNQSLYVVKTRVLDELGVLPGDVLLIDMNEQAVKAIEPLSIVVARLYSDTELLDGTTMLRQFVPPNLLVTNSREHNEPPLNMARADVHIKGIVISRHHRITPLRG